MRSRTILFCGTLFVAIAVITTSGNESPNAGESKISSVKSTIKKLSAIANVTAVKAKPADAAPFEDQTEYETQLKAVIDEMPTLNKVSEPRTDRENQVHGFQSDEFIEGHLLAKLRNLSLQNEKFISSTQTAYAGCAERTDLAQSVRAVCFMRAMEISIKLNNPQMIVDLNVPADIRRLALQLVN